MFQYIVISIFSPHDIDIRHLERLIATHVFSISVSVRLSFNLNTAIPVVFSYFRIAFHYISVGIYSPIFFMIQLTTSCFRFQDTMSYIGILRSSRSRFVVVVNHIEHSGIITTIRRTVHPIEYYIINEIEYAIPTDRRITSGVTSPKVTGKCTILTT